MHPQTKEYLARKEAEGKTTKGALRSLKRHLARHFYRLLAEPPADRQQPVESQLAATNGKPPEIPVRRGPHPDTIRVQSGPDTMPCLSTAT